MKLIEFSQNNGKINMQIDEDLLENAIKTSSVEDYFRFYSWKPACISLGRNQKDGFINTDIIKKYNIDIVRRLTGGRALLHDNELTYSYVVPVDKLQNGESIVASYKEISGILINIFNELGVNLEIGGTKHINTKADYCMLISTGADLCYNGKKFIGSAQYRKNGYILQHGSILFDYNKELLEELFKEKIDTNSIISLKEINPDITKGDIINAFKRLYL